MTRINTIAPALLPTPWLMAEYRELPRIINRIASGVPAKGPFPCSYRMGAGHVTFFYDKMHWLHQRHRSIRLALQERFPDTNFTIDTSEAYMECLGHSPQLCRVNIWLPSHIDHETNLTRLFDRWKGSPVEWNTFLGACIKHHNLPTLTNLVYLENL